MARDDRWLEDWRGEPWSEPDKTEDFDNHFQAVWYSAPIVGKYGTHGDADPQASQFATMVELNEEAFIVTEYTHISEWYMDEPWDPAEHGDFWRLQVAQFTPGFIRKTVLDRLRGTPAKRPRFTQKLMAQYAAAIGAAYIAYYGGDEDEASTLP